MLQYQLMDARQHRSERYYRKALPTAVWRKLLVGQHELIYARFLELFTPGPETRIVNIGVNADLRQRHQYVFESRYRHLDRVVGCGLEPSEHYERLFPEARYCQIDRDEPLPFRDREFDLAFCSAVVEHVGARDAQRNFLREALRVAKAAFVTTPNRWYPVELHTLVPLLHYLPTRIYRRLYRRLGFNFFAAEENLNLLDRASLATLVPEERRFDIHTHNFLGMPSNLLLAVYA